MIHNLPVYPPSNSFQSREKGLCVGLIGCTFYAVFCSLSEIVRRGPRRPWTHETEWRTTKRQSALTAAHPQHPSFHSAAILSASPLCLSATAGLKHARLSIHHLRDRSQSQSHTHAAYLPPSLSLVLALQHSIAMVLGSVSANDFRKMPSSEERKKEKKG